MLLAVTIGEQAAAASAFIDSVGVVTHFAYYDTPYAKRFGDVAKRLIELGIRHVRDTVVVGQTLVCERERTLAAHGIRFEYVTQPAMPSAYFSTWAACVGPAIEAFEGPNEYDISHPATDDAWVQTLRTFQATLYDAVKSNASTRALRVIGPSLTSAGAFRAVGDLSAYLDAGNMHDYFGAREPETRGWGAGGYGSIAYNLAAARAVSGTKPIFATESGYGTRDARGDVTEDVQAAYVPRLFLDHFAAGVPRTDEYELLDEGPEPYSHFGLLRSDLTPKPAYTALQSLLQVLDDSDATRLDVLRYSLDGDSTGLRHELFEKHDGTFYLALWVERPSIEPDTRERLAVPLRIVRVRTEEDAELTPFTYDATNRLVPGRASRRELALSLDDRVAIVRVRTAP
jgi:hypothetical protein